MNNKLPKIHLIYNRYKKATESKMAVVEIVVTYDYKQKYISTGVWLYPYQWKDGTIVNCDNIVQISQTLEKQVDDVRKVLYTMIQEGNVNIMLIPDRIKEMYNQNITFIEFCHQRVKIRKYGKSKDSQERYDRFLKHFSSWGKIQRFDDIRDDNIIAYDELLTSTGMKPYSKWNNYHRFLNGFIIDAIAEGLIKRNPYKWIPINKDKQSSGLDKCLTLQEFHILKKAKMPSPSIERVRDLFVFQTYTCLRYSDLMKFDTNNIVNINGIEVYRCIQKKTKKIATIPLIQPAISILEKYNGVLPIISNVKYNDYLKIVALSANIDKPISSHWARHTGATLLLNEGVPMQVVSKICGHSSTRITEQIYAKLLDETIVNVVNKVSDKLK